MKIAIVGSRTLNDFNMLLETINQSGFEITEVVSGGAKGVDKMAEDYAKLYNIPIKIIRPKYFAVPKHLAFMAPLKRNKEIAQYCDAMIALKDMDSKSGGTTNAINETRKLGKLVFVREIWNGAKPKAT